MPTEPLFDAKKTLRKTVRDELKQLSEEQMIIESEAICNQVLGGEFYKNARRIGVYLHSAKLREVDTSIIVEDILKRSDKCLFAPLVLDNASNMKMLQIEQLDDLVKSSYGILEPAETDSTGTKRVEALEADEPLDLLLMPGLAFDSHGNRLGRGGGYYDNYLRACLERARERDWKPPMLVALAYSPQIRDSVPMDPHDRPVDFVVCADQVILGAPTS
ncbi:hypothetical protein CYMTET_48578 [Cymbomonas tetramitiformis]|uniref:5-formyltetrahydrofolate cyclo-ligase n=1 Tax=Cymbomonas tetramitiformis TaxID=36881 RepID=A0AAE0BRZ7_9CHLO|nr:hypothetical protein CYMTET_48578 [Cymbomonas tetramitiformis]